MLLSNRGLCKPYKIIFIKSLKFFLHSGVFTFRTPEKVCCLEAEDRHTMLYWLQELQIRRRQFRQMKNAIESKDRVSQL